MLKIVVAIADSDYELKYFLSPKPLVGGHIVQSLLDFGEENVGKSFKSKTTLKTARGNPITCVASFIYQGIPI